MLAFLWGCSVLRINDQGRCGRCPYFLSLAVSVNDVLRVSWAGSMRTERGQQGLV